MADQTLEGTWENVVSHSNELAGRWVRLTVLESSPSPLPNKAIFEALRRVSERSKEMAVSPDDDSLKILREARSGKMWGYEPTE